MAENNNTIQIALSPVGTVRSKITKPMLLAGQSGIELQEADGKKFENTRNKLKTTSATSSFFRSGSNCLTVLKVLAMC